MLRKSKILSLLLCFCLLFEQTGFAQTAGSLDISSHLAAFSNSFIQDKFRPLHLRSLGYDNLQNNFKLLLDKGDLKNPKKTELETTTKTLLNYFFVGITLPNDTFWVNLRPDSEDNIIDPDLAITDVGKILLEADLQLKKDTASFTSPETPAGKEYWEKLYQKAGELFGSENITIPTLTRPWIVPGEIIIRETKDNAYIYKATLKVMLEQDYLKDSATYKFDDPRLKTLNEYSSQLIRDLIIPKLTKEINTSQRYAPLRQVYYSLILAQWFKARFYGKGGLYAWLIDRRNLQGLTSKTSWSKTTYFNAYQQSFKEGEYNIQQPVYTPYGQSVRSYFSGGFVCNVSMPAIPSSGVATERKEGPTKVTAISGDERVSSPLTDNVVGALVVGAKTMNPSETKVTITDALTEFTLSGVEGLTIEEASSPSGLPAGGLQSGASSVSSPIKTNKMPTLKEVQAGKKYLASSPASVEKQGQQQSASSPAEEEYPKKASSPTINFTDTEKRLMKAMIFVMSGDFKKATDVMVNPRSFEEQGYSLDAQMAKEYLSYYALIKDIQRPTEFRIRREQLLEFVLHNLGPKKVKEFEEALHNLAREKYNDIVEISSLKQTIKSKRHSVLFGKTKQVPYTGPIKVILAGDLTLWIYKYEDIPDDWPVKLGLNFEVGYFIIKEGGPEDELKGLRDGETTVPFGRDNPGRFRGFENSFISRKHVRFTRQADTIIIEDLGSRNGTYVEWPEEREVPVYKPDSAQAKDYLLKKELLARLSATRGMIEDRIKGTRVARSSIVLLNGSLADERLNEIQDILLNGVVSDESVAKLKEELELIQQETERILGLFAKFAVSDYWQRLGLERNASQKEIKKSYRKLMIEFHPDRYENGTGSHSISKAVATEIAKLINEAYSELSSFPLQQQPASSPLGDEPATSSPLGEPEEALASSPILDGEVDPVIYREDVQKKLGEYAKTIESIMSKISSLSEKGIINLLSLGIAVNKGLFAKAEGMYILNLIEKFADVKGINELLERLTINDWRQFSGALRELAAAEKLTEQGFIILAFNLKIEGKAEIDIIALRPGDKRPKIVEVGDGRLAEAGQESEWAENKLKRKILNLLVSGKKIRYNEETRGLEIVDATVSSRIDAPSLHSFVFMPDEEVNIELEDVVDYSKEQFYRIRIIVGVAFDIDRDAPDPKELNNLYEEAIGLFKVNPEAVGKVARELKIPVAIAGELLKRRSLQWLLELPTFYKLYVQRLIPQGFSNGEAASIAKKILYYLGILQKFTSGVTVRLEKIEVKEGQKSRVGPGEILEGFLGGSIEPGEPISGNFRNIESGKPVHYASGVKDIGIVDKDTLRVETQTSIYEVGLITPASSPLEQPQPNSASPSQNALRTSSPAGNSQLGSSPAEEKLTGADRVAKALKKLRGNEKWFSHENAAFTIAEAIGQELKMQFSGYEGEKTEGTLFRQILGRPEGRSDSLEGHMQEYHRLYKNRIETLREIAEQKDKIFLAIGYTSRHPLEQGVVKQAFTRIEELVNFEISSSPAQITSDKGGIDFRALPMVNQPINSAMPKLSADDLSRLNKVNLDSEWTQIQNMLNAGIIPSNERIKEYILTCSLRQGLSSQMDKVLGCIADIMRMEEERVLDADVELKEVLVLIEAGKPESELQIGLSQITILPQEPKLAAH